MTTSQSTEYTRLHITPLDAELFKIVFPASAAPNARNISFHNIETFPEKRYGFVDLPAADAEKLRTKLNGATLKGCKMRIEKARPEKATEATEVSSKKDKKKKPKDRSEDKEGSKKRKRDDNVDDGIELSGRKVKRGWTETTDETVKRSKKERKNKSSKSKDKEADGADDKKSKKHEKKRTKTKYTDASECLLKTQIPPNKDLSDKDKADKKKKRKGNEREVTVHEFEKTTRFPTFLKDTGSKVAREEAEYVEGRGWVDTDGNLVEAVVEKKPKKVKKEKKAKQKAKTPTPEPESDSDTSSSGTSSDDESVAPAQPAVATIPETKVNAADDDDSDTSSEGSSDEEEEERTEPAQPKTPAGKDDKGRPESSGSARSLQIKIPPPDAPSDGKVHPLEALYKRRQATGNDGEAPAKESFSFFGGGGDDDDEEDEPNVPVMPMTPFTKQDFEFRNIRSAAPTPDTAHPARMQNFWASGQMDEEDDEMDDAEAEEEEEQENEAPAPAGDRATSDFQNWFWENRRDLNQSWMKRRKTVAKEKRNRENKARTSRAV